MKKNVSALLFSIRVKRGKLNLLEKWGKMYPVKSFSLQRDSILNIVTRIVSGHPMLHMCVLF